LPLPPSPELGVLVLALPPEPPDVLPPFESPPPDDPPADEPEPVSAQAAPSDNTRTAITAMSARRTGPWLSDDRRLAWAR
jgi:hypothetical protein